MMLSSFLREFPGQYVYGFSHTAEGTAVWGQNYTYSSTEKLIGYVACVDEKGKVVWERQLDRGFNLEYVTAVLSGGDGTWAVISRGDLQYLCVTRFDAEGKELGFRKTDMGVNFGISKATALKDGYLVQLRRLTSRDYALLAIQILQGHVLCEIHLFQFVVTAIQIRQRTQLDIQRIQIVIMANKHLQLL